MRRSIDARNDILYRYRVEVYKPDEVMADYVLEEYKDVSSAEPVVIVGAGPAGMFAALRLLMRGYKPVILERGKDVHQRKFDMAKLSREGVVNPDSDYCFGDGGAGNDGASSSPTRSGIYSSRKVILATGHSARDIYEMFDRKGWELQAKGFALGVRVEHPQSLINKIQYHGKYQPYMPTAEYSFVTQVLDRGVFSFCMCPGGILVPAATASGELVLNGMSNSQRNSKWANAGVVVQIEPEDFPEYAQHGPLALLEFQKSVERKMFEYTGSLKAPAQRMMDFCRRIPSSGLPQTSYHPGAANAPLHELLPEHVSLRLKYAFPEIGNKKMHGYYTNDALLLGVESRTSSPVRIPRDPETLEHVQVAGLYPCGEGAGYAGGIVSSALDGINCAAKI